MHELSLAERLVELMEQAAIDQSFSRIRVIELEVGSLAGVDAEALRFALEAAIAGTLADGASLRLQTPTGTARCQDCDRDIAIDTLHDPCPQCGGHRLTITGGGCLLLKHLEVE